MKRKYILSAVALCCLGASAQTLKPGYVEWPSSQAFADYVKEWNASNGDKQLWDDEEFFISRVKPRQTFRNLATQVDQTLTEDVDKRLIWWVPIGDSNLEGVHTNSLPTGCFDSEAFSTWSYVTHYGNWNSPHGWVPGSFADVAHKNGVAVSGVASIPFGSITATWRTALDNQSTLTPEQVGKFLHYHGVNGLAYNSEFNGYNVSHIISLHNSLTDYMKDIDPLFENIWYAGTIDNGACMFDIGLTTSNSKLFEGASYFLNYNWNRQATITSSIAKAESMGRDPLRIYAGFNMQGAEPRSGNNWDILKDVKYSIGLWGAYDSNMFWQDRSMYGSTPATKQYTYQRLCEQWFGNGYRNPAIHAPVITKRQHRPDDNFHGMSSMMSARSALSWNLDEEPFFSNFNIGNGTFFNIDGKRVSNNEWYSIGVQDYMPTWRFWFAPNFLQGDVDKGYNGLDAEITWQDAWFGGSCLKITGSVANEYLHLFKTAYELHPGDKVTITYKLVKGSGEGTIAMSAIGKENEVVAEDSFRFLNADSKTGQWQTAEFEITSGMNLPSVAMIALHFRNADNMELRLGSIGIQRGSFSAPASPVIRKALALSNNHKCIDGKIYWTMPGVKPLPEPTYNSDLGVSMFKMYAQEEGGEPVFMGVTTTWAGICYSAPNNNEGRIRFGVSAVSLDMKSESQIAWSEYLSKGDYEITEDINLDKSIIKPGQSFTLGYVDPRHPDGEWTILDSEGTEVYKETGHTITVAKGLQGIGAYDLKLTEADGKIREFPLYISISSEAVGALPEIQRIFVDTAPIGNEETVKCGETAVLSYEGRQADGSASRGIDLAENWFGVNVGELGLNANQSFSVAAWVKYNELQNGLNNFITIEDRDTGGWPYNNWGFFWSRITDEGRFVYGSVDTAWGMRIRNDGTEGQRLYYRYDDSRLNVGAWAHVVIVFEYQPGTANVRQHFYINGKKQKVGAWMSINKGKASTYVDSKAGGDWSQMEVLTPYADQYGFDTYEPDYVATIRKLNAKDWIAFGGSAKGITSVKGCLDDFQIWDKAMTEDDVRLSMQGLDKENLPEGVLAYWDFEDAPNADESFSAYGKKAGAKSYWWSLGQGSAEGSGTKQFGTASFLPGCPYIPGTAYPITTKAEWSSETASFQATGNDRQGRAVTTFADSESDHVVTLTLTNGYGESTVTFPILKVTAAVDELESAEDQMTTYASDGMLIVEAAEDGDYAIGVWEMSGIQRTDSKRTLRSGEKVAIGPLEAGVYIVKVQSRGKTVKTAKLICR